MLFLKPMVWREHKCEPYCIVDKLNSSALQPFMVAFGSNIFAHVSTVDEGKQKAEDHRHEYIRKSLSIDTLTRLSSPC